MGKKSMMDKLIKTYALAFIFLGVLSILIICVDATSSNIYDDFDIQRSTATWIAIGLWLFLLTGFGSIIYTAVKHTD